MDVKSAAEGPWPIVLGPVERRIVIGVTTLCGTLLGIIGWFAYGFGQKLRESQQETTKQIAAMSEKQAVTNQQMMMLTTQLANVPAMSQRIAELDVRVERNTEDIKELRQTRGLK